jgi:hypothetical protein
MILMLVQERDDVQHWWLLYVFGEDDWNLVYAF